MKNKTIIIIDIVLVILILGALFFVAMKLDEMDLFSDDGEAYDENEDKRKNSDKDKQISKYDDIIEKNAKEFGVPKALIYAIIECESSFREDVTSSVGAKGLMQMMPETYKDIQRWLEEDYDDDQITDPAVNIRCGTYYFARMYNYFGDWDLAIAAYNAGPGNVMKWMKNEDYYDGEQLVYVPFKETSAYLKKVNAAWERYERMLEGK